jgi:L-lactate utilization protein LutB
MDENRKRVMELHINRTMESLQKNGMEAYYVPAKKDAVRLVESLLQEGEVITCGGSMSLVESGVMDLMKSGKYEFLDRNAEGITPQQVDDIYRRAFTADAYITSSNAITENGELFNVDGNSNRVAAMLFGPKKVIVVAGYQKITRDLKEAIERVKTVAAPANCIRLHKNTYCANEGRCMGNCEDMTSGCSSPDRICSGYTVIARQQARYKGRIKVILVGEEIGY